MKVAEEVFIAVRELSGDRSFRWKTWEKAWDAIGNKHRKAKDPSFMSASVALKTQVKYGAIKRIDRGFYFFIIDKPLHPLYSRDIVPYRETMIRTGRISGRIPRKVK